MIFKTENRNGTGRPPVIGLLISICILLMITGSLLSCNSEVAEISAEDSESLNLWLDSQRRTAPKLLKEEILAGRSAILLQDNMLRSDTIDLMRSLLPSLYDQGIREIGVFYLDSAKQAELDGFIVEGDENTLAEKLLFSADAALGYQEYCDFMEYVREFNQKLTPEAGRMRLRALGEDGSTSAELLAEALGNFESLGEADNIPVMPIFLWIKAENLSLLPDFPTENSDEEISLKAPVIIVHHGPGISDLRWNGLIETVVSRRDIRDRTFAFRTDDPPFGGYSDAESGIAADLYVVTPFEYRAVNPIPDFISAETAAEALEYFPEISMEKLPPGWLASRMNRITRRAAKKYNAGIEKIIDRYEI